MLSNNQLRWDILYSMANPPPKSRIAGVLFILTLGVPVAAFLILWLSNHAQQRPVQNDRSALAALQTLRSAEWDFRENDRDGNGINDYWTGDVAGLYRVGLIERGMAEADVHPIAPLVPKPIPYHGYLFFAMIQDDNATPPEVYAQETDLKSGKVHHRSKYAFCGYPAEPGVTGNYIYITHESYSGLSCPAKGRSVPQNWPKDAEMLQWNRCLGGG